MRLLRQLILLLTALQLLLFISCKKTDSINDAGNTIPEPVLINNFIHANVTGKVIDETNQGVAGITVHAGNNTAITDNRGAFRFKDVQLDKYASVVTASRKHFCNRQIRSNSIYTIKINSQESCSNH